MISLDFANSEKNVKEGISLKNVNIQTHAKALKLVIKDIPNAAKSMPQTCVDSKVSVLTNIWSPK